jgi:hypothetical protein
MSDAQSAPACHAYHALLTASPSPALASPFSSTKQPFPVPLLAETVRSSQRGIQKGVRDLDREVLALKREEQKLIAEIKAAAKTNNQAVMRVLAKSLVRLRGQIANLQGSKANLRGVSTNLTTAAASTTVAQSMGTATAAMTKMQQQMNPAKVSSATTVPGRLCDPLPAGQRSVDQPCSSAGGYGHLATGCALIISRCTAPVKSVALV